MPLFHFSCGNSARGTIGFCANVRADNKTQAVERLRELLPDEIELESHDTGDTMKAGEYVAVYFNADALNVRHIDDSEE